MRKVRDRATRGAIVVGLLALVLSWVLAVPSVACARDEPLADDPYADAVTTELADGAYQMTVSMEGGTGKASVSSPAEVIVKEGRAVATVEWSSPNYDYMLVAGKRYLPVNEEGNSVFVIPVLSLDEPFDVVGDTTAMSVPHEVSYQLTFDSSSAVAASSGASGPSTLPVVLVAAGLAGVALVVALGRRSTR